METLNTYDLIQAINKLVWLQYASPGLETLSKAAGLGGDLVTSNGVAKITSSLFQWNIKFKEEMVVKHNSAGALTLKVDEDLTLKLTVGH